MKKILTPITFLLFSYAGFAQTSGNYNYSIAVKGFSIIQIPKILNQENSNNYLNTYFSGVMVKFNDNQISYRLNGSYFKNSEKFANFCANCEISTGDITDYSFKIGFEKNFNYSRIQPYFAFDVGFRSSKYSGETQNANALRVSSTQYSVKSSKDGVVASPVIGLKINLFKEVSIFAESSLEYFYFYERQETVTQDASNNTSLNKYTKSEFLINPVSLGIQIHLGSRN